MTRDDFTEFERTWNGVLETYHREPLSPFALLIEFKALASYSLDDVTTALIDHVQDAEEGRFAPTAAHVIARLDGTVSAAGRAAWNMVRLAASTVGIYNSVLFPEPAIHYALAALGGMKTVCLMTDEERPHLERRFLEYYRDARARRAAWGDPDVPEVFTGETNRQRLAAGFEPEPVVKFTGERPAAAPSKNLVLGSGNPPEGPLMGLGEAKRRIPGLARMLGPSEPGLSRLGASDAQGGEG